MIQPNITQAVTHYWVTASYIDLLYWNIEVADGMPDMACFI